MPRVYINLGSNIGDRAAHIGRAVARICAEPWCNGPLLSPAVESEPWGYASDAPYLNHGLSFDSDEPPRELLQKLLEIEGSLNREAHRTADGAYADRTLDIDIIAIEGRRSGSEAPLLPHPRAALRPFVMEPLVDTLLSY